MMRNIGFETVYTRFLRGACNVGSGRSVSFYDSASCTALITVQLSQPTDGQAWQAMYAIAGYEPSMGKIIIAVDEDVDPENFESLAWALSYHTQPARDFHILPGRVPRLDPSAVGSGAVG